MLKEIVIAIQAYAKAHAFIRKHKLWGWILIPGILYMFLFCISSYFFGKSATSVINFLMLESGLQEWARTLESQWLGFLFTLSGIMLWLIFLLFYFSLFKYLIVIAGSPVFAYLSQRTEASLSGAAFSFSGAQLLKDIVRGIQMALRNSLWQSFYWISLLFLSFFPLLGWIAPLINVFMECYYFGFSMLDYSCERNKLSVQTSLSMIGRHKGLAIGNGMVFYLMHLLPVIGWVLAPSYAVIAATISLYHWQEFELNR